MSTEYNFTMIQGEDFSKQLKNEITIAGVTSDRDLTGYSFESHARLKFENALPAFAFTMTILDAAAGLVEWICAKEITSALPIKKDTDYVYSVERTDDNSKTKQILHGVITVKPEATK